MFQELLKEISSNPQSARLLQEALVQQQSTTTSSASAALPTTVKKLDGRPSTRTQGPPAPNQEVAWWKQKATECHRRLLILQEQVVIAGTRAHVEASYLDWPDGDEASLIEQGEEEEHAASEPVDRFRSGSAVDIPDSRRGRRLEVGDHVRSSSQNIRGMYGAIPTLVAIPAPAPMSATQHRSAAPSATVKSRRTPRTPSLTEAERTHPPVSHSRSVVVGSSPVVAVPPFAPAVQRADAAMVDNAVYYPPVNSRARRSVYDRSPAPQPPGVQVPFNQGNRSGAPVRSGGLGGVEAESRGASSAASSVAGALRAVRGGGRSPSPQNPKRGSNSFRNFIFSGIGGDDRVRLASAISKLTNARLVECDASDTLPSLVTHVITPGAAIRSFKALCALVSTKYVVTPQYVLDSARAGYWLEELDFDSSAFFPTRPLDQHQFLVVMDDPSLRDLVVRVITYGGGTVLHSARKTIADEVVVIKSPQELLDYITGKSS